MVKCLPNLNSSSSSGIFIVQDRVDNTTNEANEDLENCAEDEWSCHQKGKSNSNMDSSKWT